MELHGSALPRAEIRAKRKTGTATCTLAAIKHLALQRSEPFVHRRLSIYDLARNQDHLLVFRILRRRNFIARILWPFSLWGGNCQPVNMSSRYIWRGCSLF